MRIIENFGTRELILRGVELTWIFLFNYCYCKIGDLVRLKGRFETKKQKDVKRDGSRVLHLADEIGTNGLLPLSPFSLLILFKKKKV